MKDQHRISRKKAQSLHEVIFEFIRESGLGPAHNTRRIFEAWDMASGAGPFTLKKYFRDGKLYITLSSSVVRNQLFFQKSELLRKMNSIIREDPLYIKREESYIKGGGSGSIIEELILK